MRFARPILWLLRVTWVALPFTAGPALADALDPAEIPLRTTASIGLWLVWAALLLACLVPRPVGLTAVRVAAPAAVVAAGAAAAGGHASALALATTILAAALALAPETGWTFANGSAYGDERRHLLRLPGPLLLGPVWLAWALVVAGTTAGPLLLADRRWAAGAAAAVVGLPVAALMALALHGQSRRWLVFVPAGVVLHDHLSLTDPLLFRRTSIAALRPAPAGSDALDLTHRALGLALELDFTEEADLPRARPRQRLPEMTKARRILVTPTRPGAVLADARARRIRVP